MAIIGYIRVSSNKQTLKHQRFEIENFAKREGIKIDEWIEEKISSRKALDKQISYNLRKPFDLIDSLNEKTPPKTEGVAIGDLGRDSSCNTFVLLRSLVPIGSPRGACASLLAGELRLLR